MIRLNDKKDSLEFCGAVQKLLSTGSWGDHRSEDDHQRDGQSLSRLVWSLIDQSKPEISRLDLESFLLRNYKG